MATPMLIECNHCGAPLDVKPNARTTKCTYCDTTTQIKSSRTVAFETPPGWAPPPQWTPPANFAADSAKALAYHATTAVSRIVKTVILLAILGAVLPMVISVLLATVETKRQEPNMLKVLSAAESAIQQATKQVSAARHAAAAARGEALLESGAATRLIGSYEDALGKPVRARRLVIHPSFAELVAQDPQKPQNLDSYTYRGATVGDKEAYRLTTEKGKLEQVLFDLHEVSGLTRLSELMDQTLTTLGYEDGKVSHVIVERNVPFSKGVVIRVYARSDRDSGRIDFNGDGTVQRVFK
jgi:LSD1 subclass zinc finger protein